MPTAAYDGGIGGKFRKRPLRLPSSTPYDRPPAAARGPKGLPVPAAAGQKNGWLSKLVDPASRIIARSASRFFSSVFQKRLGAPPAAPDENLYSSQEAPMVVCTTSPTKAHDQVGSYSEKRTNKPSTIDADKKTVFDTNGIGELEQLLKQKTFSRVEFDRLAELLRSRTIEPNASPHATNYKDNENSSGQRIESGNFGLNGTKSNNATSSRIPVEEFASPAELARAYMGSMPSENPSSTLNLRSHILREDTALLGGASHEKKIPDMSLVPSSAVHLPGSSDVTQNCFMTPRFVGRSAMHRMSCSPYFKPPSATNIKFRECHKDEYSGASTSAQLTPANFIQSGGKQVKKRGSSVLDSDFGYFGPIRRIRQKSMLMSPSKQKRSLLPGNLISSSTPLSKDVYLGSEALVEMPLYLDGTVHGGPSLQRTENGAKTVTLRSPGPILSHSREIEGQKLQHLDELATPPKKNASEPKSIIKDNLPSKLTANMLHGRALQSMKQIDSSDIFCLQGNGILDYSDAHVSGSSITQKQDKVEDIDSLEPAVSGALMTSETVVAVGSLIPDIDAKPDLKMAKITNSGSLVIRSPQKPAFQMTAPDDYLEMDDDDYNVSEPISTGNDIVEPKASDFKPANSGSTFLEKSLTSSSERAPSSSVLNGDGDMKAKISGVPSPVVPSPFTFTQKQTMPTIPSSSLGTISLPKGQADESLSTSKDLPAFVMPTASPKISDKSGLKLNESATPQTAFEVASSKEGGTNLEARELHTSSKNAPSSLSALTSSLSNASGVSPPSLNNGSLISTSSTNTSYATGGMPFSTNLEASTASTSASTTTSLGNASLSSTQLFSTVPSDASTGGHFSVSTFMEKSTGSESKPVNALPFGTSFTGFASSELSNTGSNISPPTTSYSSSLNGASSSVAVSSLFSSSSSGFSAPSVPFTSPSTGDGIFGLSSSVQSTSSCLPVGNSTSQSFTNLSTTGSTFSSGSTQSGIGISQLSQATTSQLSSLVSPTFGLSGSPSLGSGSTPFGSAASGPVTFGSNAGLSFSTSVGSSSPASNTTFASIGATNLFSSGCHPSISPLGSNAASFSQPSTSPLGSSASLPSSGSIFGNSAPTSNAQTSASSIFGSSTASSTGFSFGSTAPVTSQSAGTSLFGSSTSSQPNGFSFGSSAPSSSSQSTSIFGSSNPPSSGFPFGQSASNSQQPSGSSAPSSSSQSTSIFGSSNSPSGGFPFGQSASNSQQPSGSSAPSSSSQSTSIFGSSNSPSGGFPFGQSASSSQQSSTFVFGSSTPTQPPPFPFGNSASTSSSQPTSTPVGSNTALPSSGFFGVSAPTTGSSFVFGAASGTAFSFTSAGSTSSAALTSPAQPVFGLTTPSAGFGTASPGNDQMNVEDSMADDTVQAAAPTIPSFGQTNSLATPNFAFGSAAPPGGSSVFQFGVPQNSSLPHSTSPFQAGGNVEFSSGGSFSLGTGDKTGRKHVKITRKYRKGGR